MEILFYILLVQGLILEPVQDINSPSKLKICPIEGP